MKDENNLEREEELRAENAFKALDLELTYGAHNLIQEDAPPELVKQFLDNVAQFEAQYSSGVTIPLYDYIGKPELPPADLLSEEGAEQEIKKIQDLMEAKGIGIDRPDHLTAIGYYRFLAMEFMHHPVPDIERGPMEACIFLYDMLRHDNPHYMALHVESTLLELLNLAEPFEGAWLSEHCRDEKNSISREEAVRRAQAFRARYSEIIPIAFKSEGPKVFPEGHYFFFGIAWAGIPAGGGEKEEYEGLGLAQMGWEDGEWMVQGILMPGFTFG